MPKTTRNIYNAAGKLVIPAGTEYGPYDVYNGRLISELDAGQHQPTTYDPEAERGERTQPVDPNWTPAVAPVSGPKTQVHEYEPPPNGYEAWKAQQDHQATTAQAASAAAAGTIPRRPRAPRARRAMDWKKMWGGV